MEENFQLLPVLLLTFIIHNASTVPVFTNLAATATIDENIGTGTLVFTVLTTPAGNTYAINPPSTEFAIDANGDVTNLVVLDYEAQSSYTLTIQADDGTTATETLTVNVMDLNDNPPTVTGNAPIIINENVAVGTVLTLPYTVDDVDTMDTPASLTYTITGADSSYFLVDTGASGQITVAKDLDYENQNSYSFDLVVTDAASASVTETLTVNLNDINDNSPVCSPAVYYTSVDEAEPTGVNVQVLACSDADTTAANNLLTYSIIIGDDTTNKFQITGSTIQTSANAIDYESLGGQSYRYTLLVNVVDSGAPALTSTATVIVQVQPVNENTPVFAATATPYSIREDVSIGTVVDTIVATDGDSGTDGTISYQITSTVDSSSNTVNNVFRIDSGTGILSTMTTLDRDGGISSYTVNVRASDGNITPLFADTVIQININDYNDNAPKFTLASYPIITVLESSAVSTSVVLLAATDADSSATLSYAVEAGDTAKFEFSTTTIGQLQLKSVIDLDKPTNDANYYPLRVIVKDGEIPELTGTVSVTVSITAVNQHDPVFGTTVPSATASLPENAAVGTLIATVVATDNDYGVEGVVRYSITGGDAGGFFTIDTVLGKITTTKNLDFDTQPLTNLEVTATDGGTTPRSMTSTVTVSVTNVNDNTPSCTSYSILVNLLETAAVSDPVTTLACTDSDTADTLTYSISNGDPSTDFVISTAGAITLNKVVDYDSAVQSYNLEITVTDGTNPVTVFVIVNLGPVNEVTPSFVSNPTITRAENTSPGVLLTYAATDTDFSPHGITQYKITSVTQSGTSLFSIDSSDGRLLLVGNLDYDVLPTATKFYLITVQAIDGGALTGTGTVTVSVTDVNDNTPICTQPTYTVNFDENQGVGINVQTLTCTDLDGPIPTLAIVSGDDATNKFQISGSAIQTSANAIDYESLGGQSYRYTLLVNVVDSGAPALTSTATVIVQVQPVNENTPVFAASATPYTIREDVSIGTVVDTIAATDGDSGTDGTISYQITSTVDSSSNTVSNIFRIDSSTGVLSTMTNLDRDGGISFYDVTVRASDGNATPLFFDVTIRVNIDDVNDNAPAFTQASYPITTIPESSGIGTSLILVAATDVDQSSTLSYEIEAGDTAKFEFSTTTIGQLQLKSVIDLDSPTNDANYYQLGVIVKDGGAPELTGTVSVTVSITAVNQHDPVFGATLPAATATFAENTAVGTLVATVVATDNDFGSDGAVTYSLTGGDAGGFFTIDTVLGRITTSKNLNFDTQPLTNLEVTATDSGTTPRSMTSTVTVSVTNVNDNTPSCTSYSVLVNLLETAAVNDLVTALTCTDSDTGDVLAYSISNGDPFSTFAISAAGAISTSKVVNYDSAVQSYNLEITVTDGTTPVKVAVTVIIDPVNEATPSFASNPTVTRAENISPGVLLTYAATDTDFSPHDITQYKITSVTQSGTSLFSIDASDGRLLLIGNLDYDILPTATKFYLITVEAIDGGASTGTGTVTVSVTDVNDNTPTCTPSSYSISINENQGAGVNVQTLACSDLDGSSVTYAIVGGDDPLIKFQVLGTSIQTSANAIDYESLGGQSYQYTLLVDVVDSGAPALTSTATVIVQVQPVNENTPVFAATATPYTIREDVSIGTVVDTIAATDGDSGPDGTISYVITSTVDSSSNTVSNIFRIDSRTGVLSTMTTLDRDGGISFYDVTVRASDGNATPLFADVTITVNIDDVNDNAPAFTQASYPITTIPESSGIGTSLILVAATDDDQSSTLSYEIDVGDTAKFEFSTTTIGQLQLKSVIDLDSPTNDANYYLLRVIVKDGGSPVQTGTASVTVSITAVNQHDPVFGTTTPFATVTYPENAAVGTLVATVAATDNDFSVDGVVRYSITGGDAGGFFTIDTVLGKITTNKNLDFDTQPLTNLEVTATDSGTTPRSMTSTVTVSVTNVNDNTPSCTSYSILVNLLETAAVSDPVTSLTCTDSDAGDVLVYSITSGDPSSTFTISAAGAITLTKAVDYDSAVQSYNLEITVTDGTNPVKVYVIVNLGPVNEVTPSFASNPTITRAENISPGVLLTYAATDTDFSPHGITQYKITSVSQSGTSLFSIDASDGRILLTGNLDYDALPTATKFYLVTVEAIDGGALTGTGTVTVSVTDINDNSPSCAQSSWTVNINENEVTPFAVVSLGCTDAEDGTTLTYNLVQTPGSLFAISTTGDISLTSALDYETATSHTLTVSVTDTGTNSISVTVNVNVVNINEGGPVFTGPFASTISEGAVIGTSVADVVANDPDTNSAFGILEYSIINGDPSNQFFIDLLTGRVFTRAVLDRETTPLYNIVVHAKEQSGANTATVTLAVTVSDVNDVVPVCGQSNFAVTVTEDKTVGFVVLSIGCTDTDTTGTLTYTITSGDTTKFEMSGADLRLKQVLDFDAGTRKYDLIITVSDGINNLAIEGTVNVGGVNEVAPVFVGAPYVVTFTETTAISTVIQTVVATDADSADTSDGKIVYSFTTPNPQFNINANTGDVILLTSLDYETAPSHVLNIQASDGTNNVATTLTLTVGDVNDNTPIFSPTVYSATISEGDPANTNIATVTATDADNGATINGQIRFSIIGGTGDFTIDATTGAITNTNTLDYETATSHILSIQAVDRNGDASSKSSSAIVTIIVTSLNELDPVFSQTTYTFNTPENSALGTSVGQAVATDADAGDDGSVYYSMLANTYFFLNTASGEINIKSALDYDTLPNHSFEVVAYDRGTTPQRSATAVVNVVLTNVNDASPICTPTLDVVTQREDASGPMTTLNCNDADSPTLSYVIESVDGVPGNGIFSVGGTGIVSLTGTLNYETATSHNIVVVISDGGTPLLTTSAVVSITVTDVNETPPVFAATPFTATLAETDVAGKSVLTVAASDTDSGDKLTYTLSSTTYFIIDSSAGLITLKSSMTSAISPYTVNVCATDSNTIDAVKQTCETMTVTITDSNDNSPVFNPGAYTATVNENAINSFNILTVTATDADTGAFGTVAFTITGGNTNNVFAITVGANPTEADITINDQTFLDYESITSYSLTITATDGGGKTTDVVVIISVTPINEVAPVFTPATSTQNIPENSALGSAILTLAATDADNGADGTIAYSIISGASGKFSINSNTGVVSVTGSLDRELIQTYSIVIHATDGGTNPAAMTGTYALTVNIDDMNDNTPSCTQSLYTTTISENTAPAASIAQLVCSDLDQDPASLNNALTYTENAASDPGSLFQVSTSGLVTVSAGVVFDRETLDNYQYSVTVGDKGTTPNAITADVYIAITDVNDNAPVFSPASYTNSPPENQAIGSTIVTITASDADIGAFGEIEYSIISGNADGKFILDTITGALILKSSLDRETTDSYTIGVQAADKGTPASVAASSITITVADLNDEPPVCNPLAYSGSIQEDVGTGTSVLTVSCPDSKDLAPNNVVQYSITAGDPSAHFNVDINSGEIRTNSALNAQVTSLYSITVTATDGVLSTTAFAQITVTDVNQQAPQFNPPGPYTVNLPEDTALGFTVIDLDATDADPTAGPFIYYITGGNADNKFKIDSSTGVIILQNSVDADATPSYSLSIEVADGVGPGTLTSTSAITVTLTGINDNKPVCNPATVFKAIPENSKAGTAVTTLTCTDADIPTPSLVYSILNGNAGGEFSLDSATGKISLTTAAFDYETKQAFTLEILVSDQGTTPGLFTATVQVAVTPINEHNLVFVGAPYTTTQPEDVAQGTTIVTVAATDNDQGLQHGIVRYSIVGGDSGGFFTIGVTSGDIQISKSLDFETTPIHTLTVRATDDFAGSGSERSVDTTLTITVTDKNDNSPKFNPDSYAANVIESATIGATILAVTSTDDDSGVNKNAVYSITSGNANGDFNFVNNELVLAKTLDFETVTSYNLVIQVVDQGIPALTDTAVISIAVQPVNEDPPILTDTTPAATISEDTSIGTTLYKATASDNDAGTDGKITYFIVSGNTNSAFLIDDTLGDLIVWSRLDFDTPPQTYMLGIEARDAGGMSDSLSLTITLTDVNDHTPLFTQNTYSAAINEGKATGTSVTQTVANDADSGVNGQVTYSIVSGDGQTSFTIVPSTGVINTQIILDHEVKTLYYLVVQAVDGGTPALTSSSLVKVSINDINDNPPIFSPVDFTVNILEDVSVATSVTTVNAKDADSAANSNNIFTYSLTDAYFSVDASTGVIMVKAALDRETTASHILTIQATDQGTPAMVGTATVTVVLDDVNDNAPIITGTYDTNVDENKAIGTLMFTIAATDADSGDNGKLTYTITNGNTNTDFKLDANAGVLQINKQLDRETTQSYTLQITVSDNGAVPRSDVISVVITVDDVNDNDPVFTGPPYMFTIAENVPNASPVNTVAATDQDVGLNAALVYDFVNFWQGNPTHFLIDASTGAITTSGALDRETTDTYVIRCRVQDKGSPIRSADVNVTITIQDLNDNTPVFDSTTYASTTIENSAFGTSIIQVTVTDADIGVNKAVTLSIDTSTAQGTNADTFLAIDSATGILSVKMNIDRESNNNFSFQLLAVDGGTPSLTSTATVTLLVSDVNDNSPIFNPVFYNSEVSHAGQCSRVITTVTATDADEAINAQLGFFLAQQSSLFTIDGTSGTVSLVSSQSANTNAKYTLDVGVSDNGSPPLTAATTAQIRIDTFVPNTIAVTFQLSISKADFEARRAQFIIELKALLVTKYPTSRIVVWCVEEREGTSISPPARRRLLATSPVNVHTYVVADDITDNQANLNQGKTFLTYDQILSVTTSDAATGTPSNSISGSAGWNYYSVEKVTAYVEETTAWEQTPVGIAIIVLCCLMALFLIGLLIFLCCRRYRKKKRPITPVKPQSMQKNQEVLEKAAPVFVSKRNNIPDLNLNEKKHPLPAVLALPMPTVVDTYEKRPFREPVWGAPDDTKIPVRTPRVSRSPRTSNSDPRTPKNSSSVRQPAKPPGSGGGNSGPERTPRNVIIEPKEQVDNSFRPANREFDGRAVDPATGNVYQYNTKTNERRWISTPDGHDIKVDMV